MVTTRSPGSAPRSVHRDRARRQHLIAVDHVAARVREQRPVGVAVVRHTRVRPHANDLGGDDLRMQRTAPDVDVVAVRPIEDRVHDGTQASKDLRREPRRRAVRAVDDERHPVERAVGRRHQMLQVPLPPHAVVGQAAELGDRHGRFGEHRLDLVLQVVGQLHPVAREELDAVVLGRVVRGGDDHTGRSLELHGEERDRRCGFDPGQDDVAAGRTDAVRQRLLQPDTRAPGVAADQERRPAGAVASEHDDGRAAQTEGQVARQVRAREAANTVGAEESPHGGKATGGGLARNARCVRASAHDRRTRPRVRHPQFVRRDADQGPPGG